MENNSRFASTLVWFLSFTIKNSTITFDSLIFWLPLSKIAPTVTLVQLRLCFKKKYSYKCTLPFHQEFLINKVLTDTLIEISFPYTGICSLSFYFRPRCQRTNLKQGEFLCLKLSFFIHNCLGEVKTDRHQLHVKKGEKITERKQPCMQ